MERRIINEKIPNHQLLVIDDEGNKLGIMQRDDAIALAQDKGLDLVLFVPSHNNQPALAKIIDYGKFAYEQKLKEKHAHKNQTVIKVKEVKVRPQTGDHDLK
jgi:translation initiation factor IF-3